MNYKFYIDVSHMPTEQKTLMQSDMSDAIGFLAKSYQASDTGVDIVLGADDNYVGVIDSQPLSFTSDDAHQDALAVARIFNSTLEVKCEKAGQPVLGKFEAFSQSDCILAIEQSGVKFIPKV